MKTFTQEALLQSFEIDLNCSPAILKHNATSGCRITLLVIHSRSLCAHKTRASVCSQGLFFYYDKSTVNS